MARKPIRIADVLGFGGSPKRDLTKGYQREVRSIPRGQKYQGSITRARPTAAEELAQLLTPDTRFGAELAAKIAPAVDISPIGVLTGIVDARRAYQTGNTGQAAGLGILAGLGAIPAGKGTGKAAAWSEARFKKAIKQYADAYDDAASQGLITRMSPEDFLGLTIPKEYEETFKSQITPLDIEKLSSLDAPTMYLGIRKMDNGEFLVEGHEGRHRMAALANEGYNNIPVILDLKGNWSRRDLENITLNPEKWIGWQPTGGPVVIPSATNLSRQNKQRILEIISNGDLNF